MTNEERVRHIKAGERARGNIAALWTENSGLVNQLARRYAFLESFEDVKQEIFLLMVESINKYDESKGCAFSSYFTDYVGFSIYRRFNKKTLIRIPEHMQNLAQSYNKILRENEGISDYQITRKLGITADKLEQLRGLEKMLNRASLSTPIDQEDGDEGTLEDTIAAPDDVESDITDRIYLEERSEAIEDALSALSEDKRDVLRAHFYENKSITDIAAENGEKYGKTWSRELRALEQLRRNKALYRFAQELNEEINTSAYNHTSLSYYRNTGLSSQEAYLFEKERKLKRVGGGKREE